jgi:hypothetical protein
LKISLSEEEKCLTENIFVIINTTIKNLVNKHPKGVQILVDLFSKKQTELSIPLQDLSLERLQRNFYLPKFQESDFLTEIKNVSDTLVVKKSVFSHFEAMIEFRSLLPQFQKFKNSKPSFHIINTKTGPKTDNLTEQTMLKNFISNFLKTSTEKNHVFYAKFVHTIFIIVNKLLQNDDFFNIFSTQENKYKGQALFPKRTVKGLIESHPEASKHTDFDETKFVCSSKTIFISDKHFTDIYCQRVLNKSGNRSTRSNKFATGTNKSMIFEEHNFWDFVEYFFISINSNTEKPVINLASDWSQADNDPFIQKLHTLMDDELLDVYSLLNHGLYYKTQHISLVAQQLIHFSSMAYRKGIYHFFNSGDKNTLYIVANSPSDLAKDYGKPFMSVSYFSKNDLPDNKRIVSFLAFYGNCYIVSQNNSEGMYIISNWRRLKISQLTHIASSFSSSLSTVVNCCKSFRPSIKDDYFNKRFLYNFFVSICIKQRFCEKITDMKYVAHAAISDYSEIMKLVLDKFKPPYDSNFEVFIVDNLLKVIESWVTEKVIGVRFNRIMFSSEYEIISDTTGGRFEIKSLIPNETILNIEQFIDEVCTYALTIKEPASMYHENVKAFRTILEYKNISDSMTIQEKQGSKGIKSTFEQKVGCNTSIIKHYSELFSNHIQKILINSFSELTTFKLPI